MREREGERGGRMSRDQSRAGQPYCSMTAAGPFLICRMDPVSREDPAVTETLGVGNVLYCMFW